MQTASPPLPWLARADDLSKIRLPGTDRARGPEHAWPVAIEAARRVGVTRVADITGLDVIGIPTFQAVRPQASTVAVSQGKGVTPALAKLSAVMEAVEIWHVEQPLTTVRRASPRELAGELSYAVTDLAPSTPSVLHEGLPLAWLPARSLADGAATLVPVDVVRLTLARRVGWHPPAFFESTNGLASGTTLVESVLHALYEVIERDAMTAAVRAGAPGRAGTRVDPRSLASPVVDELCDKLDRAGVTLVARWVPSPTDLPCVMSSVTCQDYPVAAYGFGCHLSAEIALTRAITEAAQARLGYISGARDDIRSDSYEGLKGRPGPDRGGSVVEVGGPVPEHRARGSLVEDLERVVARATAAFGQAPMVVDLTREEIGVPVVKVVAPGSRICPEVL